MKYPETRITGICFINLLGLSANCHSLISTYCSLLALCTVEAVDASKMMAVKHLLPQRLAVASLCHLSVLAATYSLSSTHSLTLNKEKGKG